METHIDSAGHNAAAIHHRSIFDLPPNFFDSCRLLESPSTVGFDVFPVVPTANNVVEEREAVTAGGGGGGGVGERWSCNSCKQSFESLQEQRAHFKSDFHRFNIKLSIAGKDTMKEEDFDELTSDSLCKDYDISSISGSDDEDDKESGLRNEFNKGTLGSLKRKVFVHLQTGERVSLWKCLLVGDSERISFQHDKSGAMENNGKPFLVEKEVTEKLRHLIHEPRDNSHLRVVLLARGGHFAGCVFDGNSIVAHKTFHRYVIRAKAGKKQSSKDASGKTAHSAGASMRRHNELSLKKDIRELLASWKPYFDYSSCILVHAPSNNRQLLFDGEKPYFSCQPGGVRSIPLTVRRPTLKEARRIYNILTQISRETDEEIEPVLDGTSELGANIVDDDFKELNKDILQNHLDGREIVDVCSHVKELEVLSISSEAESEAVPTSTALHEAAKSGNAEFVLELLEQGMDPCMKDERGRTPYMLATEKEVRNTFRRFMASNLDKWDWQAAKVPSPLTKEMEESQTAKQAEKDAKKKARAKELKKLRKAKEKKAQAEASQSQNAASIPDNSRGTQISRSSGARMSREEELKRAQDEEREKRAAAAERRIAALKSAALTTAPTSSQQTSADINCSCCHASLVGKVPFHRYNYKYCSTSCMHVHREIIEDG